VLLLTYRNIPIKFFFLYSRSILFRYHQRYYAFHTQRKVDSVKVCSFRAMDVFLGFIGFNQVITLVAKALLDLCQFLHEIGGTASSNKLLKSPVLFLIIHNLFSSSNTIQYCVTPFSNLLVNQHQESCLHVNPLAWIILYVSPNNYASSVMLQQDLKLELQQKLMFHRPLSQTCHRLFRKITS
jgi:hypothetical protein